MPRRNWLPPLLQCPGFPVFFCFQDAVPSWSQDRPLPSKSVPSIRTRRAKKTWWCQPLIQSPLFCSSELLSKFRLSASLSWTVALFPLPPSLPPISPLHLVFTPEPDFPSRAQIGCVKRSLALSTRDGPLSLSTGCNPNSPRGGLTVANLARLLLSA